MEQLSSLPKAKMLCRLTELEIKKNIFIVGHRLFSIQNPMNMPWELSIESESGQRFIPRTIALSLQDISIFYNLFGFELVIPLLIAQDQANSNLQERANTEAANTIVRCRVLDVGTYYTDHGLRAGDYLECQRSQEYDTVFKVRPIFAKHITVQESEAFYAALDTGLDRAINTLKYPRDPQTMIRTIFQEAPDLVRENPKGAFSDYYNKKNKIQMYVIDGQSYLWASGMDTQSLQELLEHDVFLNPLGKQKKNKRTNQSSRGNTSQTQHLKRKQKRRPPAEKLYTFKITLANIEPEIYRYVLIPGNRNLAEVSEIILTAMGWTGYHLHLFEIRGKHYGEPIPDDWDPLEDERKVRLDNLRLRKGSHFVYIYDYGDNWVHDITIVGTQKANPDIEQVPLLLEGQRACPPEDCGGIYGYTDILTLLSIPKHLFTQEEKELFAWLPPGFNPEYFDIQTTMQALSTL